MPAQFKSGIFLHGMEWARVPPTMKCVFRPMSAGFAILIGQVKFWENGLPIIKENRQVEETALALAVHEFAATRTRPRP